MRYFLISYLTLKNKNVSGYGDFLMQKKGFPSRIEIKNYLLDRFQFDKLIINSIYEFNSIEDYLDFKKD